jgi:hypothetical protein
MSYVDEYRDMVSTSRVVFSSDRNVEVFSYPDPDGFEDYGWDVWRMDYDSILTEDNDWPENDCAG